MKKVVASFAFVVAVGCPPSARAMPFPNYSENETCRAINETKDLDILSADRSDCLEFSKSMRGLAQGIWASISEDDQKNCKFVSDRSNGSYVALYECAFDHFMLNADKLVIAEWKDRAKK